jgi:NAD-reducing hydrogenase large subunit
LHYGSVLDMHATSFVSAGHREALALRGLGKAAMAAAGSPGHFPVSAVVGGVAKAVAADAAQTCARLVPAAIALAQDLFARALRPQTGGAEAGRNAAGVVSVGGADGAGGDGFPGADVALVDGIGQLDLLGERLRAVTPDGQVIVAGASPDQWDEILGPLGGLEAGSYRVGPVAQLRVAPVATPLAAKLQADWLDQGAGAQAARAVLAAHCVEVIGQLVAGEGCGTSADAVLVKPAARLATPSADGQLPVGVGWVDGARGLLVHRYQVDQSGLVERALVLTPTEQNQGWLSWLLKTALTNATELLPDHSDAAALTSEQGFVSRGLRKESDCGEETLWGRLEEAVREADPCLPCVLAPPGQMGLEIKTVVRN